MSEYSDIERFGKRNHNIKYETRWGGVGRDSEGHQSKYIVIHDPASNMYYVNKIYRMKPTQLINESHGFETLLDAVRELHDISGTTMEDSMRYRVKLKTNKPKRKPVKCSCKKK